jgi:N-acetylmuramoyl-L-alanine amidase
MLAYRRLHSDPTATDLTITPRLIVLHYTAGHSAKNTHNYFDRVRLEKERAHLRKGGEVNVVSHFLVDRDGTIYRLIPETRMGRHTIGVNHVSIGVENVGDEDEYKLTDAQQTLTSALASLGRQIAPAFFSGSITIGAASMCAGMNRRSISCVRSIGFSRIPALIA